MNKSYNNIYSLSTAQRNDADISGEELLLPPCLFQHKELVSYLDSSHYIDKKKLISTLNHTHFTNGSVLFHLRDQQYGEDILIEAYPEPCLNEMITCRWSKDYFLQFGNYQFQHLVIVDGLSVIIAPVTLRSVSQVSFSLDLPDRIYSRGKRQARRHKCQNIIAELDQSGFLAKGTLIDFSPLAFRVKVTPDHNSSFLWFNPDGQITIALSRNKEIIFSGLCRCVRETLNVSEKELVLSPANQQIKRFKKKKCRNPRIRLTPPPYATFEHPFFHKTARLDIDDVAISGFSVREKADESVLLPGMIIPELNITFSGKLKIKCKAQVIYRRPEKKGYCRCGFAMLDMDIVTYRQLANIITNSIDNNVHISDDVDLDDLWQFFFHTGFIYPNKYNLIQSNKKSFEDTYKRLYQDKPEIATHITYQKNGRIYGHASMVRAYEGAWMFHHLAALPIEKRHTGLPVLKHILHYLSGLNYLPSVKFNYLMFYFRPENRFPNYFFGDLVRDFKDPRRCSLDLFSYKSYTKHCSASQMPEGWLLRECASFDVSELERFYNYHSGGLLLDILGLKQKNFVEEPLEMIYHRYGMLRRWKAYSLIEGQKLKAVLIVDQSNMGLNLSELLNNIKILVCDQDCLPWNVLSGAIDHLIGIYETNTIPIMVFPDTYLEEKGITYEKKYLLWLADIQYGPEYLEYMRNKMKMKLRFFIKFLIKTYLKK